MREFQWNIADGKTEIEGGADDVDVDTFIQENNITQHQGNELVNPRIKLEVAVPPPSPPGLLPPPPFPPSQTTTLSNLMFEMAVADVSQ